MLNNWTITAFLVIQLLLHSNISAQIDPRYHTYGEVLNELDSIANTYPEITRLESIGVSTNDSITIWALKISDNPDLEEDEPSILYNGAHHAREVLGVEICMYMINYLVNNYSEEPKVTRWIDSLEIWFVPIVNPEGYKVVWEGIEVWRKNKRDNNENGVFDPDSDGVDLNRNYDFNWGEGNSDSMTSDYYRGPCPFSEMETQAMRNLCLAQKFVFAINYHSPLYDPWMGEHVFFPWVWHGVPCPDYETIREIADSLASLTVNDAGDGTYQALYTRNPIGMARNWMYGVAGIIALTVEVSDTTFVPGSMVDDICERNSVSAYFLLDRVYGSGITGRITDALTGKPLQAEVKILECYDPSLPPRESDPVYGRYWRILTSGTYTVEISKEGYASVLIPNVTCSSSGPTSLDVELSPTGISMETYKSPSELIALLPAKPNPFNGTTTIEYSLNRKSEITITIYDTSGQMIRRLIYKEFQNPGYHTIRWNGQDENGIPVPAGVYYFRLSLGCEPTGKIILLR